MKRFLQKIVLFTTILLFILFIVEYRLHTVNSAFGKKWEFITKNKEDIAILVLGTSHSQDGINPQYFDALTANMAFGGQDLRLDSLLLKRYINDLPSLKYVVLELSYHTLEQRTDEKYHRNALYLRYHGIDNFGDYLSFDIRKYSIFFSAPQLYAKYLLPSNSVKYDEYGFHEKLRKADRFEKRDFDTLKIHAARNDKFVNRHNYNDLEKYQKSTLTFQKMIDLCIENNVTPVISIPPVYKTYYDKMIPEKKTRRDAFLNDLLKKHPNIILLDYEKSSLFTVQDFRNEDHLNIFGAKKLTEEMNSRLFY